VRETYSRSRRLERVQCREASRLRGMVSQHFSSCRKECRDALAIMLTIWRGIDPFKAIRTTYVTCSTLVSLTSQSSKIH
jgi:hypothetical protein